MENPVLHHSVFSPDRLPRSEGNGITISEGKVRQAGDGRSRRQFALHPSGGVLSQL